MSAAGLRAVSSAAAMSLRAGEYIMKEMRVCIKGCGSGWVFKHIGTCLGFLCGRGHAGVSRRSV